MQKTKIESITTTNYLQFATLLHWRRTGSPNGMNPPEIPAGLDSPHYFLYGIKVEDQYVGYISASIIPKPDYRVGTMFIDELWVAPEYRQRGFAKQLLLKVIELTSQKALWRLRLYVEPDNRAAIRLYESVGLKNSGSANFMELDCASAPNIF